MKDERSIASVDAAINYDGDREKLKKATEAADVVDSYAAYAANYAADADYYVAYHNAVDYDAAYDSSNAAKKSNQQLTADICRKYLPIEIWNIKL
jgi:uncharacterized protein YjaG (DUF416 family)